MKKITKIAVVVVMVAYVFQCVVCATALQEEHSQLMQINEGLQSIHRELMDLQENTNEIKEGFEYLIENSEGKNGYMGIQL